MPQPTAPALELHYQPVSPTRRRRRLIRRVVLGVALLALIAFAWGPGRGLWRDWQVRSITSQSRTFTFPHGTVIYEQDPADGGSLIVAYKSMPLEPRDKMPPAAHGVGEARGPDLNLLPPSALILPDGPADPGPIRIFAAHPDPADASAFLLPYDLAGRRRTILFKLVDDSLSRGAFVITVNHPRPRGPTTTAEP